jgi:hypothetical protein
MRLALERLTDPLFGWIPDLTVVPRSRQVAVGVAASILIHLLIFGGAIVAMFVLPERVERPPMAPEPKLELVVQRRPQPKPETPELQRVKEERRFLTNEGLKPGEKPKDAKFEADRDMTEGTEVPKAGASDLPGQEGEKAPFMRDFIDQDISLDRTKLALRQEKMEPPPPAASAAQPAAIAPMYAPNPLTAEERERKEKLAEPAKPTRATPPPLKVKTPNEDQIAIAQTPSAAEQKGEQEKTQPATKRVYAMATPAPPPSEPVATAFDRQLRKTHNESIITRKGVSGVNAVNTPAGRWVSQTNRAFSRNWQNFVDQNRDMVTPSSVRVTFSVGRTGGRPKVVKVEPDSHANLTVQQICTRAIADTPLSPPPDDLFEDPSEERLEDYVTFNLY